MNLENKGIVVKDTNNFTYEKINWIDLDTIPDDYCVIETKAAGFGPYDVGFITGRLRINDPKRNFNLGLEGSGVVIKLGNKCDSSLLGKRVAFLADYHNPLSILSFAKFSVVDRNSLIILPEKIDFAQGAYILANPLTAKGLFIEVISKSKSKSIIQDTSSSSLGKMITKICLKNGIKIINIVRKEENIKLLEEIGSTFNLNSSDKNFLQNLEKFVQEINPDVYITYQGGNFPSRVFDKMPFDSKMVSCGNINNENLHGFSTTDFIFKGKSIEGFQILNYIKEISEEEKKKMYDEVFKSVEEGEPEYLTQIYKEYALEDFEKAYESYKVNSSLGKIVLKP
jgi:NADPH:quinone reductase-like Zn-dependent oxidoreductase